MTFEKNLFARIDQLKNDIELVKQSWRNTDRLLELQCRVSMIHEIIWPLRKQPGFDFIDKAVNELLTLHNMIGAKIKQKHWGLF
ncbi:hypothetical protein MOF01_08245 [Bacillus spizizenii]|nr:hypothetical protein [Bacillus spizizenii]